MKLGPVLLPGPDRLRPARRVVLISHRPKLSLESRWVLVDRHTSEAFSFPIFVLNASGPWLFDTLGLSY